MVDIDEAYANGEELCGGVGASAGEGACGRRLTRRRMGKAAYLVVVEG